MNLKIATTLQQGHRLLACEVSDATADMYIDNYNKLWAVPFKDCARKNEKGFVPAWSFARLLELMPKQVIDDNGDSYYFSLSKEFPMTDEYGAAYIPCWFSGSALVRMRDDSPIEACVQLIEWIQNKKSKIISSDHDNKG